MPKLPVEVVEYRLPHGQQRKIYIAVTHEKFSKLTKNYKAIHDNGANLAVETLATGQVSATIEHPLGDYDIRIVPGMSYAPTALAEMIVAFQPKKFQKWLAEREEEEKEGQEDPQADQEPQEGQEDQDDPQDPQKEPQDDPPGSPGSAGEALVQSPSVGKNFSPNGGTS